MAKPDSFQCQTAFELGFLLSRLRWHHRLARLGLFQIEISRTRAVLYRIRDLANALHGSPSSRRMAESASQLCALFRNFPDEDDVDDLNGFLSSAESLLSQRAAELETTALSFSLDLEEAFNQDVGSKKIRKFMELGKYLDEGIHPVDPNPDELAETSETKVSRVGQREAAPVGTRRALQPRRSNLKLKAFRPKAGNQFRTWFAGLQSRLDKILPGYVAELPLFTRNGHLQAFSGWTNTEFEKICREIKIRYERGENRRPTSTHSEQQAEVIRGWKFFPNSVEVEIGRLKFNLTQQVFSFLYVVAKGGDTGASYEDICDTFWSQSKRTKQQSLQDLRPRFRDLRSKCNKALQTQTGLKEDFIKWERRNTVSNTRLVDGKNVAKLLLEPGDRPSSEFNL